MDDLGRLDRRLGDQRRMRELAGFTASDAALVLGGLDCQRRTCR